MDGEPMTGDERRLVYVMDDAERAK